MKKFIKKSIRIVLEILLYIINNFIDFVGYIYNRNLPNLHLRVWIDERLQD